MDNVSVHMASGLMPIIIIIGLILTGLLILTWFLRKKGKLFLIPLSIFLLMCIYSLNLFLSMKELTSKFSSLVIEEKNEERIEEQARTIVPLDSIELKALNINPEIIKAISNLSQKVAEKNSVIRYKPSISNNNAFDPYDSLISGIKFSFVKQELSYQIIKEYFDKVKDKGYYLYLTKLDFDDSFYPYYDIALAPVSNQLELIKLVGTEQYVENAVEWFRKKQLEFDFQIYVADLDRIEAFIISDPQSYDQLGQDIYEFCPDVIDQGHPDMKDLVQYLKTEKHMWFWWD